MSPREIHILRADTDAVPLPLVEGSGTMGAVVWPGMGAQHRTMHRLTLRAGARTVRLCHPRSEAVYYVAHGRGLVIDEAVRDTQPIQAGMMFHVTSGTPYRIQAEADELVCIGGPCPPDAALYAGIPAPGGSA